MKYFLIICISLGLLLQTFSKSLIVLQFRAQQSFIAQVLCENRNKPEMHCNGKCYLKKKLDRDASQDKNSNSNKERYEVMFVNALPERLTAPSAAPVAHIVFYADPFVETPIHTIFHPPQSLS
ncbi:hypothetical protein HHL17_07755 [Chitinophaga sp. G-6-1-13]|uniref:Uncharacterized protein n=1 Tax=Chitinophaga fulva TaxID=2728842 RepID=A0A848GH86_9BACT|nr:hypothetical protein [Chitinophaga fulva]NML37091.1 hypothetical protein [Chitinophaga fulva]